jgi:hypothetical protein
LIFPSLEFKRIARIGVVFLNLSLAVTRRLYVIMLSGGGAGFTHIGADDHIIDPIPTGLDDGAVGSPSALSH